MARVVLTDLTVQGTVTANTDLVATNGNVTGKNVKRGSGSPEGAVTGAIGDLYQQTNGVTGATLWQKKSGAGNTGWEALGIAHLINAAAAAGRTIYVSATDPSGSYTMVTGDIWLDI